MCQPSGGSLYLCLSLYSELVVLQANTHDDCLIKDNSLFFVSTLTFIAVIVSCVHTGCDSAGRLSQAFKKRKRKFSRVCMKS